jgi:hypothetical protein
LKHHAPEDGVRTYDDNGGATIGVEGHIHIRKLVLFLLHGNVTQTPGLPPELAGADPSQQELIQAALQNLPVSLVADKVTEGTVPER